MTLRSRLRDLATATRPHHPDTDAALSARWSELPDHVRTDAQLLGRRTVGCEATHGVFPRCNLACTPCYHAKAAQQVGTDGAHTVAEVQRQMAFLREVRGTGQHAQLIGGEVSLLPAEAHARALEVMLAHGRKPMSMSHGDFDEEYLRDLALDVTGRPRFRVLRMAGHFDSLMLGRRAVPRPKNERELDDARRAFVAMFERLRSQHGVRYDLAHNMTITPRNLDEVGHVTRTLLDSGFGMLSFQPAAHVGNPARWKENYAPVTIDRVWNELEQAVGRRLPWQHLQMGDARCNRSAYGIVATGQWHPILDDRDPRDLRVRDRFLDVFGGMDFDRPRPALIAAVTRVAASRPDVIAAAVGWAARFVRRVGVRRLLAGRPRSLTFVVHAFMDARVVAPAWEALERGEVAQDPEVRAAQERLQACSYAMAHPQDGRTVPACAQHVVFDPQENEALRHLLPMAHR